MVAASREGPDRPGSDDARLVERIQSGEDGSEGELVRRFGRGLMVLLRRSSRDSSVVDDLYQETFRIALEKVRRGELREPEKLSGFLAGLARNLVIEFYRRESRRRVESEGEASRGVPDPEAGPLDRLLEKERSEIVRQVLSELGSERDRQILFRFYLAEDEKSRICEDLGLSPLHFNRVLFRARERYRELFEKAVRKAGGSEIGWPHPARNT